MPTRPRSVAHAEVEEEEDLVTLITLLGRASYGDLAMAVYRRFVQSAPEASADARIYDATVTAQCLNMRRVECVEVLRDMQERGVKGSAYTYNMVIQACGQCGDVEGALLARGAMHSAGVAPNSFTYVALLEATNYRGHGQLEEALGLWKDMRALMEPEQSLCEALAAVYRCAVRKAPDAEGVRVCFASLEESGAWDDLGEGEQETVVRATVRRLADLRDIAGAMHFFTLSMERQMQASTGMYNEFIRAAVQAGQVKMALDLFEWMAEGRGNGGEPVVADQETYEELIRACHRRGLLEKALEVLSWMQGAGLEASQACLEDLVLTSEVALLWDAKALEIAAEETDLTAREAAIQDSCLGEHRLSSLPTLCPPALLRPSPFDGMRQLYLSDAADREEEMLLAAGKLGVKGWAPPELRPAAAPSSAREALPPAASVAGRPSGGEAGDPTLGLPELQGVKGAMRHVLSADRRATVIPPPVAGEVSASFLGEGHGGPASRPTPSLTQSREGMKSWLPSLNRFLQERAGRGTFFHQEASGTAESRFIGADMALPDQPLSSTLPLSSPQRATRDRKDRARRSRMAGSLTVLGQKQHFLGSPEQSMQDLAGRGFTGWAGNAS